MGGDGKETLNDYIYPLTPFRPEMAQFHSPWLTSVLTAQERGQIRATYFVSQVAGLLAMSKIFVFAVSSYFMASLAEDLI